MYSYSSIKFDLSNLLFPLCATPLKNERVISVSNLIDLCVTEVTLRGSNTVAFMNQFYCLASFGGKRKSFKEILCHYV